MSYVNLLKTFWRQSPRRDYEKYKLRKKIVFTFDIVLLLCN